MKPSFLYALTNSSFRLLFVAEMLTMISVHFLSLYLIYLTFSITSSNSAVAGIILTFTLPAIFFGVLAGIYVDKRSKKYALIFSNIIRAILLLSLLIVPVNLYFIFVASFLFFTATQFFIPAETSIIPLVVKKDMLLSANALFGFGMYGSLLIAFILVGPAVIFLTHEIIYLILIGLLLASVACLIPLKHHARAISKSSKVYKTVLKDEFILIYKLLTGKYKIKSSVLLLAISQVIIILLAAIAPGYASSILGLDVKTFPLIIITPAALGVLIGAILVVYLSKYIKKSTIINIGLGFSSLALFSLSFGAVDLKYNLFNYIGDLFSIGPNLGNFSLVVLMSLVLGISNSFVFISSNTLLLENTIDNVRGKIYGVISTLVGILSIIPLLLAGSFSDIVGVNNVLIAISVVLFVITIIRFYQKYI